MTYTGFTPHKKQQEIIDGILKSDAKYHIVSCGRQIGKTLLGINLCLYWMINEGPCKVLWVSPVYSQANKVHKELYNAIVQSGIVKSNNFSDNRIELKNGSSITFRSAERYDTIRGETMDRGWIDESAYIKEDAWREAIRPVFATKPNSKVCFTSSPRGKNWFYDLYQLGMSPDHPRYQSYTGSSYDTPYISIEEIEDAKRTLPENIFRQEYLAEFIDDGGEVFTNLKKNEFHQWPQPKGKVYVGIDLGKTDYSVAVAMDSTGQIVDIYRNNKASWAEMLGDILVLIKKWNATAMCEINGLGDPLFEQLQKGWNDIHPFVTTARSKNEIVEGLILDMNEGTIRIPSKELFPALQSELEVFTYEYNIKTRSIRYGHPNGLHDDTVISACISNYCRKKNKTRGTYAVLGGR